MSRKGMPVLPGLSAGNLFASGAYTPTVAQAGNTFSAISGSFVKMGPIVFVSFAWTATSTVGTGTALTVSLPYAIASTTATGGAVFKTGTGGGVSSSAVGVMQAQSGTQASGLVDQAAGTAYSGFLVYNCGQ